MKSKSYRTNLAVVSAITAALAFAAPQAFAAGGHSGSHSDAKGKAVSIGKPGKAANVGRTINIVMQDNFYEPESLSVNTGETVRFVIKNTGDLVHEFNIGTASMHEAHQKEMAMMVEHGMLEPDKINSGVKMGGMAGMSGEMAMSHDDPNSVLLEPGQTAEIVWRFEKTAGLEFACNVPGHYESGMTGDIKVKPLLSSALEINK